jgi:hypothetical protein
MPRRFQFSLRTLLVACLIALSAEARIVRADRIEASKPGMFTEQVRETIIKVERGRKALPRDKLKDTFDKWDVPNKARRFRR